MHTYTAYGLHIHSELQLPELVASKRGKEDLVIQYGEIEHTPGETNDAGRYARAGEDELYLYWERVGSFLIEGNHRILVDPRPDIDENLIRIYLLGPVLGPLLHQCGLLTLHASAVNIDGAVVGFLGDKGWGKSTTAAALHKRGYPVVADDILAIDVHESSPQVLPGFPRLKLMPQAATALGDDPDSLQTIHRQMPKRARFADEGFLSTALPLQALYVLGGGTELAIRHLSPQQAFLELTRHTFNLGLIKLMRYAPAHLHKRSALAQTVPVRRLERTVSLDALSDIAQQVEEDVALITQNNSLHMDETMAASS